MGRTFLAPGGRQRVYRLGVTAVLTTTALAFQLSAGQETNPEADAAFEKFLARPAVAHQYTASRHLEASGSGLSAWLDVQTAFTWSSGLEYEVTGQGGSGYILNRVLRSLLDEEQRLVSRGGTARVALSTDNYQFAPEGFNGEGLAVVTMKPRRKDRSLIVGRMFLTPIDADPVRVEGLLARNPSFWVTRVNVVRSYRRINGALVPVALDTTAQLRLLGASVLRMTYDYSSIDEQPVTDEQVE